VSDKFFIIEVCKQYKLWAHFFNEKRKKQFIPLPWKIGEIIVKNISHVDEFSNHFDNLKLREVPEAPRFDPNDLFTTNVYEIGYGSSFVNTTQFKK